MTCGSWTAQIQDCSELIGRSPNATLAASAEALTFLDIGTLLNRHSLQAKPGSRTADTRLDPDQDQATKTSTAKWGSPERTARRVTAEIPRSRVV